MLLIEPEACCRLIEMVEGKERSENPPIATGLLLGGDPLGGASPSEEVMEEVAKENRETSSTVIPLPPGVESPSVLQQERERAFYNAPLFMG